MNRLPSKILSCLLAILIIYFPFSGKAQKTIPPDKPKLVIGIVIEQMRYDYLWRYWDKLDEGGFKRLLNEGTLCKNAYYDYVITESSAGYATIASGANPSVHGIISDEWYHRLKKYVQYCTYDEESRTIGGNSNEGQMSPIYLISSTLSDEIKMASNYTSKVISVGQKDYASILQGGHIANAAYWMENETGNWITSSYYLDKIPAWVSDFNNKKIPDIYLSKDWTPLLDIAQYKESLWDKNAYEIGIRNQNSFPYNLISLKNQYKDYSILKNIPAGNTYTKDFAIAAMVNENLGKGNQTDFLSIAFSANGYMSDVYGPRAVEIQDTYLRLDKDLAHFLAFIDSQIGKENVLIYLTSDRGTGDIPQYLIDTRMPGGYFNAKSSIAIVKSYLRAVYGDGDWIKAYINQQIYLNQILIEDSKLSLGDFQLKIAQFLVQFQGVANAVTGNSLQTTHFSDGILKKFQNSYNQSRSADVIFNLSPGWSEKNEDRKVPMVTTHNSPYEYDTHVPLIWYGWKMKRTSIARKVSISDIAPTISSFLNIPNPNAATGEAILELME